MEWKYGDLKNIIEKIIEINRLHTWFFFISEKHAVKYLLFQDVVFNFAINVYNRNIIVEKLMYVTERVF